MGDATCSCDSLPINFLVVLGFLPIWKLLFRIIVGVKVLVTRSCDVDRSLSRPAI